MHRGLDGLEQYGVDVILGRVNDLRARLLRVLLGGLSGVYRIAVGIRGRMFRARLLHDHDLGCTVISIGNLTVGGTGKTPVVEMFARALQERGRRVAVLSRGYKSKVDARAVDAPPRVVSDGSAILLDSLRAGDEPFMLASNLPGVPVVVDKNRVKAGRHAIRELDADTLVLDDGLQYLRLRRRVDVVLVDQTAPFGNGHLLPRGTLREPPAALRRAGYVLLTKCGDESNDALVSRIRRHNRTAEIIECRHRPVYLEEIWTGQRLPLSELEGKYVGAISGIAVPEGFENGLEKLGARIEVVERYADHHRYSEKEVKDFLDRCLHRDLHFVVTTEKDAVRFPKVAESPIPVYFLRIEIEIVRGKEHFEAAVERLCPKRDSR